MPLQLLAVAAPLAASSLSAAQPQSQLLTSFFFSATLMRAHLAGASSFRWCSMRCSMLSWGPWGIVGARGSTLAGDSTLSI